jgi:peptidoglycan/LPS O-acetylase OafA/YrhL
MPRQPLQRIADDLRSQTLVSFLDMSRWVAAALVFIAHLRNPLFLGYGDLPPDDRTLAVQLWYFVTGWHAEAVTVFFVLSGLLVGGAGSARVAAGQFQPWNYAVDRFTRLYLAFLPALFLGYALDLTGSSLLQAAGFWDHSHPLVAQKVNSAPFGTMLSGDTLVGNVFMLQHFFVTPLGSNQPLWTISAEFWFYVVFLLAVVALNLARGALGRVLAGLLLGAILALLGPAFLVLLGLWTIGVAIAFVPPGRWQKLPVALALLGLLLVLVRLNQTIFDANALLRDLKNYAIAFSFAYVIVCMRGRRFALLERLAPLNAAAAGFSYSLYLLHFPLMLFILGLLHASGLFPGIARGFRPTEAAGIAAYVLTIAAVYAFAWAFSLLTERNTERARRWLKKGLSLSIARLGRS